MNYRRRSGWRERSLLAEAEQPRSKSRTDRLGLVMQTLSCTRILGRAFPSESTENFSASNASPRFSVLTEEIGHYRQFDRVSAPADSGVGSRAPLLCRSAWSASAAAAHLHQKHSRAPSTRCDRCAHARRSFTGDYEIVSSVFFFALLVSLCLAGVTPKRCLYRRIRY